MRIYSGVSPTDFHGNYSGYVCIGLQPKKASLGVFLYILVTIASPPCIKSQRICVLNKAPHNVHFDLWHSTYKLQVWQCITIMAKLSHGIMKSPPWSINKLRKTRMHILVMDTQHCRKLSVYTDALSRNWLFSFPSKSHIQKREINQSISPHLRLHKFKVIW